MDKIAKKLYSSCPGISKELLKCFGERIFCSDGKIDYRILGAVVFSKKDKLEKLNAIMFEKIEKSVCDTINKNKNKDYVFIDAAILFGTGLYKLCDYIVLVTADRQTRETYLRKKGQLSQIEIKQRIEGQHIKIIKNRVDFVIKNRGSKDDLRQQVDKILKILHKKMY